MVGQTACISTLVDDGTVVFRIVLTISQARSLNTDDMQEDVLMRPQSEMKSVHCWKMMTGARQVAVKVDPGLCALKSLLITGGGAGKLHSGMLGEA